VQTYPIMLNLHARRAVIVGGGSVGTRKLSALVQAGADVALITGPEEHTGEQPSPQVQIIPEKYRPEILEGAFLVVACTDDRELNDRIATDARRMGALVNVADDPEKCDFFFPAITRNGPLVIAVGTGGAAPGLAVKIRDRIAGELPEDLGRFAELLSELRKRIRRDVPILRSRARINRQLADETTLELFRTDGQEGVRKLCEQWIEEALIGEEPCESSASE